MKFIETCHAVPEQYDVFEGSKQIAYVRIRWGEIWVSVPDCGGKLIYHRDDVGFGRLTKLERPIILKEVQEAILGDLDPS